MATASAPGDESRKFQYAGSDVGPAYVQLQKTAPADKAWGWDKVAHSIDAVALSGAALGDAHGKAVVLSGSMLERGILKSARVLGLEAKQAAGIHGQVHGGQIVKAAKELKLGLLIVGIPLAAGVCAAGAALISMEVRKWKQYRQNAGRAKEQAAASEA